jgi:hypothetical protein
MARAERFFDFELIFFITAKERWKVKGGKGLEGVGEK